MIAERLIREALCPSPVGPVVVKAHVRKKPANPKREALHSALRRAVRDCVPTERDDAGVVA